MGYNVYDEIAELIEAKGEVSVEEAREFARELSTFIQETLNEVIKNE